MYNNSNNSVYNEFIEELKYLTESSNSTRFEALK